MDKENFVFFAQSHQNHDKTEGFGDGAIVKDTRKIFK